MGRRSVWSNSKVQKLARKFALAADEEWSLRHRGDEEGELFKQIGKQGHNGGIHDETLQGMYAFAPSGLFLTSNNTDSPEEMVEMLQSALNKYSQLQKFQRLRTYGDRPLQTTRYERFYPENGLVLRITMRDLPRASQQDSSDWRSSAWNLDYAWFKKQEARRFLPVQPKIGDVHKVPSELTERLARLHLIDQVRGQSDIFQSQEVRSASMQTHVSTIEGTLVTLRIAGYTLAQGETSWSSNTGIERRQRGINLQMLGKAQYDLGKGRFLSFELVALGERWGSTRYNARDDDGGPAPIGFLLSLAGSSSSDRVAPSAFWDYGWD